MEEAIEALTDQAYGVLADRPRYLHDGVECLQRRLRQIPQHLDVVLTRDDLAVTGADAKEMTSPQWAMVQEVRRLLPDATATLRVHKLAWKGDAQAPTLTLYGVLVTSRVGPFTLRREYATCSE